MIVLAYEHRVVCTDGSPPRYDNTQSCDCQSQRAPRPPSSIWPAWAHAQGLRRTGPGPGASTRCHFKDHTEGGLRITMALPASPGCLARRVRTCTEAPSTLKGPVYFRSSTRALERARRRASARAWRRRSGAPSRSAAGSGEGPARRGVRESRGGAPHRPLPAISAPTDDDMRSADRLALGGDERVCCCLAVAVILSRRVGSGMMVRPGSGPRPSPIFEAAAPASRRRALFVRGGKKRKGAGRRAWRGVWSVDGVGVVPRVPRAQVRREASPRALEVLIPRLLRLGGAQILAAHLSSRGSLPGAKNSQGSR